MIKNDFREEDCLLGPLIELALDKSEAEGIQSIQEYRKETCRVTK